MIDVGAALPGVGIKSFDDVRKRQYTVGASGGGSTTVLFPSALNAYGGAQFKIVRGYKGTQRHPVGHGAWRGGHRRRPTIARHARQSFRMDRQRRGDDHLPSRARAPPAAAERADAAGLSRSAMKAGRCLRAVAGTAEIGRSIITTPGVPEERLAALRQAFQAMLADLRLPRGVREAQVHGRSGHGRGDATRSFGRRCSCRRRSSPRSAIS